MIYMISLFVVIFVLSFAYRLFINRRFIKRAQDAANIANTLNNVGTPDIASASANDIDGATAAAIAATTAAVNETPDQKSANKIIVFFKENKYDVTDFARKHPGGKVVLIDNNGKDIEELMLKYEHSKYAYRMLEKYKINN